MDMQPDLTLPEHIRGRIARIEEYTNGEKSTFYDSHLVQDAMIRNLQTIAESTHSLEHDLPKLAAAVDRMTRVAGGRRS